MSERPVATGKSQAVTEKNAGWVEFEIDVGSQYPIRLATKKSELIELGRAAHRGGERMDWIYTEKESDKINEHSGKPYINRYLEGVEIAGNAPQPTPEAAVALAHVQTSQKPQKASGEMTKEEWARKDSAIHKDSLIKAAADALKHTIPSDPSWQDLNDYNERVLHVALAWHRSVLAERDDPTGEDVPF